jgi:hypothetical protein
MQTTVKYLQIGEKHFSLAGDIVLAFANLERFIELNTNNKNGREKLDILTKLR